MSDIAVDGDWGGGSDAGSGGSGNLFSSLSGAVSGISGGISSLFSSSSYKAEGASYRTAAAIAGENARLTEESTAVKTYAAQRRLTKTLGSQQAEVAGAGFGQSGTALSLMRDSTQQGHLEQGMIGLQGQINENAYLEQQQRALGEAQAAETAAKKAQAGAGMDFLGTAMKIAPMLLML